jgi:hypothetical protein
LHKKSLICPIKTEKVGQITKYLNISWTTLYLPVWGWPVGYPGKISAGHSAGQFGDWKCTK